MISITGDSRAASTTSLVTTERWLMSRIRWIWAISRPVRRKLPSVRPDRQREEHPFAFLKVARFGTVEEKRLEVNSSVTRYQRELRRVGHASYCFLLGRW
jgi:hypothetical protein